jgi:plastocyanin
MSRIHGFPLQLALLVTTVLPACGGDGDDGGTPPATTAIAKASNSGDGQTGRVGQPLPSPIQVVVTEAGTPAVGVTVTWTTTAQGAFLAATSLTDATGVASNSWTLGTVAGQQTAQASLSGASGSPVSFTATAAPDAATELEKVSGDEQVGEVGTQLPNPLIAKASDQFGNGVPGVAVSWSASDGSVSAPSVLTDQGGASAVTVTLGGTEGPITIIASADVLSGSPQTFTATAVEPGPSTNEITVVNDAFQPASLTVSAGTTVVWTWGPGAFQHNVNPVATEPARSGNPVNAPASYQFTFNTPGTYNYYCQVHGSPTFGMRGTIIVE